MVMIHPNDFKYVVGAFHKLLAYGIPGLVVVSEYGVKLVVVDYVKSVIYDHSTPMGSFREVPGLLIKLQEQSNWVEYTDSLRWFTVDGLPITSEYIQKKIPLGKNGQPKLLGEL